MKIEELEKLSPEELEKELFKISQWAIKELLFDPDDSVRKAYLTLGIYSFFTSIGVVIFGLWDIVYGNWRFGIMYIYILGALNIFSTIRCFKKYKLYKSQMRALLIDDNIRKTITRIIDHAEKNVFSVDDLLDIMNKQSLAPGEREGFGCNIEVGYRVVYSIEMQNAGKCRNLNVSINKENRLPPEWAVKQLIREFGFKSPLYNCILNFKIISLTQNAISVQEVIKD